MTELLVTVKHILVVPHKNKAIDLWKKLDAFTRNFDRDLLVEVQAEQGLVFVPDIYCLNHLIREFSHHGK